MVNFVKFGPSLTLSPGQPAHVLQVPHQEEQLQGDLQAVVGRRVELQQQEELDDADGRGNVPGISQMS